MRVTGAQHMAMIGIDVIMIALLARWQSSIVLRYAAEAPLQNISDIYRSKLTSFNLRRFVKGIRTNMVDTKSELVGIHDEFKQAIKDEIQTLRSEIQETTLQASRGAEEPLQQQSSLYLIRSPESEMYHLPARHGLVNPPAIWSTKCGWKFGLTPTFEIKKEIEPATPWRKICGKCMPQERASRKQASEDIVIRVIHLWIIF